MHTREHILPLLRAALRAIGAPMDRPIVLDLPRRSESRGDLSTGIPLSLAGPMGLPPRRIAEAIIASLPGDDPAIAAIEIAGPGFINITFTPAFHAIHLHRALVLGNRYGRAEQGSASSRRTIVRQVSLPHAHPDDPTTIRGALLAHAIATLLAWRGDDVALVLDPGLRSTPRAIAESLGPRHAAPSWAADGAERKVMVIDARRATEPREEMEDATVVRHGALSLGGMALGADGARRTDIATLHALADAMGPSALRLMLLGEPAGHPLHPDPALVARHSGANPLYAPSHLLFATRGLLRAAAAITPFDLHALPLTLASPASLRLARHGLLLPEAIERSAATLDPSILVGHLIETAMLAWPILGERPLVSRSGELDTSRLPLLAFAAMVIGNGVDALGGGERG